MLGISQYAIKIQQGSMGYGNSGQSNKDISLHSSFHSSLEAFNVLNFFQKLVE